MKRFLIGLSILMVLQASMRGSNRLKRWQLSDNKYLSAMEEGTVRMRSRFVINDHHPHPAPLLTPRPSRGR